MDDLEVPNPSPDDDRPGAYDLDEERARVAHLHLQGLYQHEIAHRLGITRSRVYRRLAECRRAWLQSALVDFNEAKAKVLASIDLIERKAHDAYERSILRGKSIQVKETEDGAERTRKVVMRDGNPAFLGIMLQCAAKRAEIFGLSSKSDDQGQADPMRKWVVAVDQMSKEQRDILASMRAKIKERTAAA